MIIVRDDRADARRLIGELRDRLPDHQVTGYPLPAGDLLVTAVTRLPADIPALVSFLEEREASLSDLGGSLNALEDPAATALRLLAWGDAYSVWVCPALEFLEGLGSGITYGNAERMTASTSLPVLAVMGRVGRRGDFASINGIATRWNYWSLQAALLRLQGTGLLVVRVDEDELWQLCQYLARRLKQRDKPIVPRPVLDPLVFASNEVSLLAALPKVGPERAADLLRWCGSVAAALSFLSDPASAEDDRSRPRGLTPQVLVQIRECLGLENGQRLAVVSRRDEESGESPGF